MILLPFILSFLVFEIGMFFMKPTFSKAIVYYIVGVVMLMLPSLFVVHTGVMMVILGWLFYIFRKRRGIQYLLILVYSIFSFLLHPYSLQWTMVFSIIAIHFIHREKKEKTTKAEVRKPWLEFFGNKPFTQEPERAISQADQLLDYKSWSEEDRKMFSEQRRREEQALLAQDYALETARAEGIEQGLKKGLVNLVRQHLLTAEVASAQLGMTVAEFEALL